MRAVVAWRRLSPGETLFETEDFLIEAVVFVAVFCESLLETLFCVVGRHDCCDGDEDGDCYDALDNCDHCCGTAVAIWRQLGWMSQWVGGVVGSLVGLAAALLLVESR
jgi:hypothetical protein